MKPEDFIENEIVKVSYAVVAKAAETTESVVIYVLKQLLIAVKSTATKDYPIKLNVRVGFLKISNMKISFEST